MPAGEGVRGTYKNAVLVSHKLTLRTALALSDSYIVAVTTKDYVRVYTLFGTPYKVYRQKSPAVSCAAWRDYVMTVGNGPLGCDGRIASLRYTVENVKRDEICQNEDVVALPEGAELRSIFFSDTGVSVTCSHLPAIAARLT